MDSMFMVAITMVFPFFDIWSCSAVDIFGWDYVLNERREANKKFSTPRLLSNYYCCNLDRIDCATVMSDGPECLSFLTTQRRLYYWLVLTHQNQESVKFLTSVSSSVQCTAQQLIPSNSLAQLHVGGSCREIV